MSKKYDIKKLERAFSEDFSSTLYSILANTYLQNNDLDRAYTVCQIGLEHHPDDVAGQFILAKTYLLQNNFTDSKALLKKILSKFPLHINARKLLIKIFKIEKNKSKSDYHEKQLLKFSPFSLEGQEKAPAKKIATKKTAAKKTATKKTAAKKTATKKNAAKKIATKKTVKSTHTIKEPFIIDKKMATFTLVSILVKQKHFHEALKVLDVLYKEGKDKKKIKQKRNSIKKLMEQ